MWSHNKFSEPNIWIKKSKTILKCVDYIKSISLSIIKIVSELIKLVFV